MESKLSSFKSEITVSDFLSWFQREYLKRRNKNLNFSIRAFANYLSLAAPTVSHLLSGKRKPSAKFVAKLFSQLDATPAERNLVIASLNRGTASLEQRSAISPQMIALDAFKLISDWYHYAILEFTSIKGFRSEPAWIADQLEISVPEARQAIDRLLRLELIEIKKGQFVKTNAFVTNYDEGMTSSALKQLQRHVLEKALSAIDLCPANEKDITSITMAIDEKRIPEAKKRIKEFRRSLCQYLEDGEQTRVFNLGIQLYPLSKHLKK